jgi:hypothetical protein
MRRFILPAAALCIASLGLATANAAIIFDDFNAGEGHFNVAPNFSGTSVGEHATSTADHTLAEAYEGAGSQRLEFKHDGSATSMRIRHLSGVGTPANNIAFTTGPGVDGFIGFFLKVESLVGTMDVQIALDGAGGTAAEMDGGVPKSIIGDGQWHKYEWNLDNPADWGPVFGIGGTSPVVDGSHTIDSIMFLNGGTGAAEATKIVAYLDLVKKSDGGTIPEPATFALLGFGLAAFGLAIRRRSA